ncbi:hypothetical protein BGZ80_004144, partial [Entomortierella chlamydospora]
MDFKVKVEDLSKGISKLKSRTWIKNTIYLSGPSWPRAQRVWLSSRGQGSGLSFIHVGTSEKSQVPARRRGLIVEEESESDAEDLGNPWTPPAYTGHELDINPPVFGASGPKMTCLYTQIDFDEDESQREIEQELDLELRRDLEEGAESSIHKYEQESLMDGLTEGPSRKRKREVRSSYSQITEELVKRLIDHWVINMCSVTEAAHAVYMNPRTAWRNTGEFPTKKRRVVPKMSKQHCEFIEKYLDDKPLSTLREFHMHLHNKFPEFRVSLSRGHYNSTEMCKYNGTILLSLQQERRLLRKCKSWGSWRITERKPANVLRPTARGRNISALGAISSSGIIGMSVLVVEPNQAPAAETRGGDESSEAVGDGEAVVEVPRGRGRAVVVIMEEMWDNHKWRKTGLLLAQPQ